MICSIQSAGPNLKKYFELKGNFLFICINYNYGVTGT